ncbi:MAG: hypothetical protein Q8T03_00590 [Bacteroidota bacterium]|nr:hypothetical protein [Bacteroidota bacterium]
MELLNLTHLKYNRLFFSVNDNFLSSTAELDADINYCIQVNENINNALNEFYTLLIDLSIPIDKIWDAIYYRTKTEINSFINHQNFDYNLISNLSETGLNSFIKLYDAFAKNKKISKAEKFRLNAYNKHKILFVSYIKQNNEFVCINFYRVTKKRATNLYSFNLNFLNNNSYSASHYGRAHRTLHWLDIQEFKILQAEAYDFCGWYNELINKDLLNINKFKEQFTQYKIKEYSGVIYKNKLLTLLNKLR